MKGNANADTSAVLMSACMSSQDVDKTHIFVSTQRTNLSDLNETAES